MQVNDKIAQYGLKSINNFETLTLFIPQLKAAALCNHFNGQFKPLMRASIADLKKLGLTTLEANRISAIGEIFKRMAQEDFIRTIVKQSKDVFEIFKGLSLLSVEEFHIAILDRKGEVISTKQISIGGVAGCVVDVKVVAKYAVDHLASSIICVHNHPSGNLRPSEADIKITKMVKDACALFDIRLLDHIIIGDVDKYYSFGDEGMM